MLLLLPTSRNHSLALILSLATKTRTREARSLAEFQVRNLNVEAELTDNWLSQEDLKNGH